MNETKRGETTEITQLPYRRHSTKRPILYDFYTKLGAKAKGVETNEPGGESNHGARVERRENKVI